jgi:hypothetical protein
MRGGRITSEGARDRAALEASLDAPPWLTLLALADWHEERGEAGIAAGYRWLVAWERSPTWMRGNNRWRWYTALYFQPRRKPTRRAINWNHADDLPDVTLQWASCHNGRASDYRTRSRAYRAAAWAVGRWLKEAESAGQ